MKENNSAKDKDSNSRRDFLRKGAVVVGACSCGASLLALLQSCEYDWMNSPTIQGITKALDLNKDADLGSLQLKYGLQRSFPDVNYGIPVIIIRIKKEDAVDSFAAYSSLCTHESCFGKKLWVQKRRGIISCECHGSEFDGNNHGKVTKGPAERPLKEFSTRYDPALKILSINF